MGLPFQVYPFDILTFCLFCLFVFETRSHTVDQAGLGLRAIFLPQPPRSPRTNPRVPGITDTHYQILTQFLFECVFIEVPKLCAYYLYISLHVSLPP